jgi:hypothetical protein
MLTIVEDHLGQRAECGSVSHFSIPLSLPRTFTDARNCVTY